MTPSNPILEGVDGADRLSADDMATLREGQFLAAALARQAAAGAVRTGRPGWCAWCTSACLPLAVYCDDECRRDHEANQRTLRRQGRGR
jgi:hypothetical protein